MLRLGHHLHAMPLIQCIFFAAPTVKQGFICPECRESLRDPNDLVRHLQNVHGSDDPSTTFDAVVQVPPGKERWCSLAPNFHHSTHTQQHPPKMMTSPFSTDNTASSVTIDIEGFQPIVNVGVGMLGRNVYPFIPILDSTTTGNEQQYLQHGPLFGLALVVSCYNSIVIVLFYVLVIVHSVHGGKNGADANIESLTSPLQVVVTEDAKANMVVELMSNIQVVNRSISDVVVGLDSTYSSTFCHTPSSFHQRLLHPEEEKPLPLQVRYTCLLSLICGWGLCVFIICLVLLPPFKYLKI